MDAPDIRYAQTSDSVTIAYTDEGEGLPLLQIAPQRHFLHAHRFDILGSEAQREFMSARYRFIRIDGRGTGASQRDIHDFSLPTRVADLLAVLDALDVVSCIVWAYASMTMGAVALTRHPDRVRGLILLGPVTRMPREQLKQVGALASVSYADWGLYAQSMALAMGLRGDDIDRHAEHFTLSVEPDDYHRWWEASDQIDITDILSSVRCPTLLVPFFQGDTASAMAAAIPDARVSAATGDDLNAIVDRFLRELAPSPAAIGPGRINMLVASAAGGGLVRQTVRCSSPSPTLFIRAS